MIETVMSNKKEEKLVTGNEVDKWQDPFREESIKDGGASIFESKRLKKNWRVRYQRIGTYNKLVPLALIEA